MNLITAYRIAQFIGKQGPLNFFPQNYVLQALNRQRDLRENITEMAELGLVVIEGEGKNGSKRMIALSKNGADFMNLFETNTPAYTFMVPSADWKRFEDQAAFAGLPPDIVLGGLLRSYKAPTVQWEKQIADPDAIPDEKSAVNSVSF